MSKKFRLIPSVLFKQGSVVKSVRFSNHRVVGDLPSTMRVFSRRQADELVIFDLDATVNRTIDWDMIKVCVENSNMPLTYGGGVTDKEIAIELTARGFDKICFNTAVLEDPKGVYEVAKEIGSSSTLATIDLKKVGPEIFICSRSGKKPIRKFNLVEEIHFLESIGVGEVIINCIENDGMMTGYNFTGIDLKALNIQMPILISGGCSGATCIKEAYFNGFDGAIMSSIFLWQGDSIPSLKNELRNEIPIRELI